MAEMMLITARLLQDFQVSMVPGQAEPVPVVTAALRPKDPLWLRFELKSPESRDSKSQSRCHGSASTGSPDGRRKSSFEAAATSHRWKSKTSCISTRPSVNAVLSEFWIHRISGCRHVPAGCPGASELRRRHLPARPVCGE